MEMESVPGRFLAERTQNLMVKDNRQGDNEPDGRVFLPNGGLESLRNFHLLSSRSKKELEDD
jgi:hypothetical protein